jgi:hypothetical protein
LHDFVLRRDAWADGWVRFEHERPGDASRFALVDLRQSVGILDFVIFAAGEIRNATHFSAAENAVRAHGDGGDRNPPGLERVERSVGSWRGIAVADDDHVLVGGIGAAREAGGCFS